MSAGNPFAWTSGEDADIVHQEPIGGGGYGEVHRVSRRLCESLANLNL
jgi:hypothetical protein